MNQQTTNIKQFEVTFLSPIKRELITWQVSHYGLMYLTNKALIGETIKVKSLTRLNRIERELAYWERYLAIRRGDI